MALKKMRASSGKAQKPQRGITMRHRTTAQSVSDVSSPPVVDTTAPDYNPMLDSRQGAQYVDIVHNPDGSMVNDPDTIPVAP